MKQSICWIQTVILLTSVLTSTSSFANDTITTGNLLSQDFNNWNGNIPLLNDEIHNDHVLPGIEGGYMEYTVNQADIGLSPDIINQGFSSTLGADIWFWSYEDQTVIMTQTYDDGMGNVTDQHRSITGTCGNDCYTNHNYNRFTDTLIIAPNAAINGSVTARFDFTSLNANPQYPLWHNGADIEHPTLQITYTRPEIPELFMPELLPPPENLFMFIPEEFFMMEENLFDFAPLPPVAVLPKIEEPKEIDRPKEIMVMTYIEPEPMMEQPNEIREPQPIIENRPAPMVEREPEPKPEPEPEPIETAEAKEPEPKPRQARNELETDIIEEPKTEEAKLDAEIELDIQDNIQTVNTTVALVVPKTQTILGDEPDLAEYATVNEQMFDDRQLPSGDPMFFKQIKLEGYDKTIYNNKRQLITMLLSDPVFVYEVKLKKAQQNTDKALLKLKEALSARDI